jgi:hypothetical protein
VVGHVTGIRGKAPPAPVLLLDQQTQTEEEEEESPLGYLQVEGAEEEMAALVKQRRLLLGRTPEEKEGTLQETQT